MSDEGGKVLDVCHNHFIKLVVKGKLADFVVQKRDSVKCQMVGCTSHAVRRVLILGQESRCVREVRFMPDGSLWEEGITDRWMA